MSEAWVSGPRADYFCERCAQQGKCSPASPWRDLPIKKPRCPECGASRWMKRLYEGYSPNISTNGDMQKFKAADDKVEGVMLAHQNSHDAALRAEVHARRAESVVPAVDMRVRALRPEHIGGAIAPFGGAAGGVKLGGSNPTPLTMAVPPAAPLHVGAAGRQLKDAVNA